jgi:hypothetical protein
MKVTTAKHGFRSLVAAFFLFGAFLLTTERAEAQVIGSQSLNWMQTGQAEAELVIEINKQYNIMAQSTPGTPQHTHALTHFYYYRAIHFKISDGSSVPEAVVSSLHIFDGNIAGNGPKSAVPLDELGNITLTKAEVDNIYNDAVALLTL